MRHRFGLLIFLCFIGHTAAATWAAYPGDKGAYEPTRESLSRYQVPQWFHDAKIGFFYH